jgi:predicted methyltransferase
MLALLSLAGCGEPSVPTAGQATDGASDVSDASLASIVEDAVASPGRTDADRLRDAGRKPGEVLKFFGIAPGMTVLDMFSGGGYYTEMLSQVVGSRTRIPRMPDLSATKPLIVTPTTVSPTSKFCGRRITNCVCLPQSLMPSC